METIYAFLPIVGTGGSTSVADAWFNLRYAGATARVALIKAAANRWNISPEECRAEKGNVINKKHEERLTYGELAEEAATIEIKELPKLKDRKDFSIIGKPVQRLDVAEKIDGSATFGLDVRLEGMLYAVVRHPSTIGGKILSIRNEDRIMGMKGVKKVFISEYGPAIVIADNTWRASIAAKALDLEEDGANQDLTTESIQAQINELLQEDPIEVRIDEGDVDSALAEAGGKIVEARYDVPYLAHATMEPMNCTVMVKDQHCECWVGHQAASVVHNILKESTGIKKKNIKIHTTYLGGGFGRRAEPDFVRYAGSAAKEMPGVPIQVVFTREEDMQNDTYRPIASCRFKAKVTTDGDLEAFDSMSVLQSASHSSIMRIMPSMATAPEKDETTVEGIEDMVYSMNNRRVSFGNLELPIQVGFWRSVGFSQNGFFAESFMDECAHTAGVDPYLFRKSKLKDHPRFEAVLDKVAEMSNWSDKRGRHLGIALIKSFGSIVGEVAELRQIGEKEFKLDKVYCAVDCGNYVNPDIIEAQIQGGVVFGLTAALYGEITWENGAVQQMNFPQYEMVRMNVCPEIEVEIMDVDELPGGIGEPGTPPIAPALANALFAATGERVRSLPLVKHGYKFV
jgi:isoquinoline 1-oxidoreductase beta subunit